MQYLKVSPNKTCRLFKVSRRKQGEKCRKIITYAIKRGMILERRGRGN